MTGAFQINAVSPSPTAGCGSSSSPRSSSLRCSLLLTPRRFRPADAGAVTQNRRMAARWASAHRRIDALTFGLGSGIAGLAGVALSQIDNVAQPRPELHHRQFMVVVFGGVGNLGHADRRHVARHRQQVPRAAGRARCSARSWSWCSSSCSSRSVRAACSRSRAARWRPESHPAAFPASHAATAPVRPRRAGHGRCRSPLLPPLLPPTATAVPALCRALVGNTVCATPSVALARRPGLGLLRHPLALATAPLLRLGGYAMGMYLMRQIGTAASTATRSCRLHGVPELEGAALVLVGLRHVLVRLPA